MNLSETWTHRDVWESGWEPTQDTLNWHQYVKEKFVANMSHLSWSEQRLFKDAYEQKCKQRGQQEKCYSAWFQFETNGQVCQVHDGLREAKISQSKQCKQTDRSYGQTDRSYGQTDRSYGAVITKEK